MSWLDDYLLDDWHLLNHQSLYPPSEFDTHKRYQPLILHIVTKVSCSMQVGRALYICTVAEERTTVKACMLGKVCSACSGGLCREQYNHVNTSTWSKCNWRLLEIASCECLRANITCAWQCYECTTVCCPIGNTSTSPDRLHTCNTVRSVHSYMHASLGRTMLGKGEIKPLIIPYVLFAQLIDTVHTLSTKYT